MAKRNKTTARKFAFIMDPLERVLVDKDTTFVFMLEAQFRGHEIYFLGLRDLYARGRQVIARARQCELTRRGMTAATVARRLSAIRQLYRFLYAEGQRKDDPAAVLEGPKRVRALPKTLTLSEVDRLLRVATICDPAAPLAVRLRAARLAWGQAEQDAAVHLQAAGTELADIGE